MKQEDYKYKPIPATFDGVKYRSRTEASWAMLFSYDVHCHIVYEPEGMQLKTGPYLVDFYDEKNDYFIEIKANKDFVKGSIEKFISFTMETEKDLMVVPGRPPTPFQFSCSSRYLNEDFATWLKDDLDCSSLKLRFYKGEVIIEPGYFFTCCSDCGRGAFSLRGDYRKASHPEHCYFYCSPFYRVKLKSGAYIDFDESCSKSYAQQYEITQGRLFARK